LRTHVEFRSNQFPAYDGEEDSINPGVWGKRLSEYLVKNLRAEGIETLDVGVEDWGYLIGIRNDGFFLGVGCSHQDGDDDEFVCLITPDKPNVRKLFKAYDTTEQVGRVSDALDKILTSDPEIHDVRWEDGA
jgi:hypothetical protein